MTPKQKAEMGKKLLRQAICEFLRSNGGSATAREIRDGLPVFKREANSDPFWGIAKPMVDDGILKIDKTGRPHRILLA